MQFRWSMVGELFKQPYPLTASVLLPFLVIRLEGLIRRTVLAYLLIWIPSFICFVSYPTIAPRPEVVVGEGFFAWLLRIIYVADPPYNCFPSLHVASEADETVDGAGSFSKRLQELTAKGRAPEAIGTFQIEPEERERLLRIAFVEQFGTNIAAIIQTNLSRLTSTNQPASMDAQAKPKSKRSLFQRVTGLFARHSTVKTKAGKPLPKADRQALSLATPELMEKLLAETVPITDDNFRELMTARARWVQDWLVQHGQVSADRLFLVAPKSVDARYHGECRVVLSVN